MKKAVLLINLGTPDSPEVSDVGKYLKEFLNDSRVIDYPYIKRKLLVNGIIVPFRKKESAKIYKKLWTDEGSPLLFHLENLSAKVQNLYGDEAEVFYGMRYQSPSLSGALEKIRIGNFEKLIVVPLYPQYASSSTGSTTQKVMEIISKWEAIPTVSFVQSFFREEGYINSFVKIASQFDVNKYDKVVFSFHGLPERHINKICNGELCKSANDCIKSCGTERTYCYRSACYETAREIAKKINLSEESYIVAFQSRLGKDPWISPYTDIEIANLGKEGAKKLLVFSAAFVADCLETTIEIGTEFQEIFVENGGEKIQLVPSLNSEDFWVESLKGIIEKY
jgi:ferrochelatase